MTMSYIDIQKHWFTSGNVTLMEGIKRYESHGRLLSHVFFPFFGKCIPHWCRRHMSLTSPKFISISIRQKISKSLLSFVLYWCWLASYFLTGWTMSMIRPQFKSLLKFLFLLLRVHESTLTWRDTRCPVVSGLNWELWVYCLSWTTKDDHFW